MDGNTLDGIANGNDIPANQGNDNQNRSGRGSGDFNGPRRFQGGRGRGGYSRGGNRGHSSSYQRRNNNPSGQSGRDVYYGIQSEQELKVLSQKLAKFHCTADAFVSISKRLDARNDRFERCVRISRDITIESKRIIYQLQRLGGQTDSRSRASTLNSVHERLRALVDDMFKQLHAELVAGTTGAANNAELQTANAAVEDMGECVASDGTAGDKDSSDSIRADPCRPTDTPDTVDHYYYARAFSPGMQEFIEALTLYHFMLTGMLMKLSEVRDFIDCRFSTTSDGAYAQIGTKDDQRITDLVSAGDYILGIFDLPGELNRIAVVEAGSTGDCSRIEPICQLLQRLYTATKTMKVPRDIWRSFQFKLKVLKMSLIKVEKIIYELEWRKHDGLPLTGCSDTLMMAEGEQAMLHGPGGTLDGDSGAASAATEMA